MLMSQYSQSSLNELLNSDRHVDHDRHLQSQPKSEGTYTMLSLKIPQILVDRDRHLHSEIKSSFINRLNLSKGKFFHSGDKLFQI